MGALIAAIGMVMCYLVVSLIIPKKLQDAAVKYFEKGGK